MFPCDNSFHDLNLLVAMFCKIFNKAVIRQPLKSVSIQPFADFAVGIPTTVFIQVEALHQVRSSEVFPDVGRHTGCAVAAMCTERNDRLSGKIIVGKECCYWRSCLVEPVRCPDKNVS